MRFPLLVLVVVLVVVVEPRRAGLVPEGYDLARAI